MSDKKDCYGNLLPDSDRLTKFGEVLRQTSLDEIPSFWNVLRGDMSIIGPRPLPIEYEDLYTQAQASRHKIKPGVTGWAQVNGRNEISWPKKFALDIWYIENRNFWIDCKIICLTVWVVLRCKGIRAKNHVTMPAFRGESK